jgi:hypothetical protein
MFKWVPPQNIWFCDENDVTLSLGVAEPRDELPCEGLVNAQEWFIDYTRWVLEE